jgi:hypothetical protein
MPLLGSGADGDEPILRIGVGVIEDLQVVRFSVEELTCFLKGNTMLLPIDAVLGLLPDDPHRATTFHRFTKSMAYVDSVGGGQCSDGQSDMSVRHVGQTCRLQAARR